MALDDEFTHRLTTAEGHLAGIGRMIENHRPCCDVLRQLDALQGSILAVRGAVLEHHLRECVLSAVGQAEPDEIVDSILAVLPGPPRPQDRPARRFDLETRPGL